MTDEQKQKMAEEYAKESLLKSEPNWSIHNAFLTGLNARDEEIAKLTALLRDATNGFAAELNRFEWLDDKRRAEVNRMTSMLEKAAQYLREGKAKFAHHTTNSFVDDWLKDFEALQHTSKKEEV